MYKGNTDCSSCSLNAYPRSFSVTQLVLWNTACWFQRGHAAGKLDDPDWLPPWPQSQAGPVLPSLCWPMAELPYVVSATDGRRVRDIGCEVSDKMLLLVYVRQLQKAKILISSLRALLGLAIRCSSLLVVKIVLFFCFFSIFHDKDFSYFFLNSWDAFLSHTQVYWNFAYILMFLFWLLLR